MRINIQTKLFLLLAGLTAVILSGVLLVINRTVSEKTEQKVIADFNRTQFFIQKQQGLVYDRLVESCYLIGENSVFKANVALSDPASVYFTVDEFASFAKVDLFIVTDRAGKVLARHEEPAQHGDDLSGRPSIARALSGIEPDFNPTWAELWELDGALFQVVSLPVYAAETIIGTITMGNQITSYDARELKGESEIDISILLRDRLLATTLVDSLTPDFQERFLEFVRPHEPVFNAVVSSMISSGAFSTRMFSEKVYTFVYPLGQGEPACYLATVPQETELRFLNALQKNIVITAGVSLVLTILFAFFLGKNFSRPILGLVKGMNRVKEGDLSVELRPTTKDEIGLLTQTFNQMIVGLRERIKLMKYVGSHTLDMIKKTSADEVSLGGTRKELAVLFSDVRGFTAFSENRTPEQVIDMLNKYLGLQAEQVSHFNGSVDKFVGDEMVALFSGERAVHRALDCAVAIQKIIKMEKAAEAAPIEIGIGINFGSMILGNMGATDRMDYTVIGAAVNLASRLCSTARSGQILVPRNLVIGMEHTFKLGEVKMMSFKGFSQEIQIVEVLSE